MIQHEGYICNIQIFGNTDRGPYPWERDQVTALQREAGI